MSLMCLAPEVLNAVFSALVYYTCMAVLLGKSIFTFWCWILVISRYAIMFRFGPKLFS